MTDFRYGKTFTLFYELNHRKALNHNDFSNWFLDFLWKEFLSSITNSQSRLDFGIKKSTSPIFQLLLCFQCTMELVDVSAKLETKETPKSIDWYIYSLVGYRFNLAIGVFTSVGWISRTLWWPSDPLPPACSTMKLMGAHSYKSLNFPFLLFLSLG